jgi:hypothetical protein
MASNSIFSTDIHPRKEETLKGAQSLRIDGIWYPVAEVLGYVQGRGRCKVVNTPNGERVACQGSDHQWRFADPIIQPRGYVCGQ